MDYYSHIVIITITHQRYTWLQSTGTNMSLKQDNFSQSICICIGIYVFIHIYGQIHVI